MRCKFFRHEPDVNNQRKSVCLIARNYESPRTINLLQVSAPDNIDIMLKPQKNNYVN